MLIKVKRGIAIASSEITPESVYHSRRKFMQGAGLALGAGLAGTSLLPSAASAQAGDYEIKSAGDLNLAEKTFWLEQKVMARKPAPQSGPYTTDENITPFDTATTYNNFYEFGTGKQDPSNRARDFRVDPWTVEVKGECGKPGNYTLEDILRPHTLEERIYRMRCVERWSMVIPWVGFPLADLVSRFEPNGNAKYVEFLTLVDPDQMPEQRSRFSTLEWPYHEGLRMDEAMHPLTIMAVGIYGNVLPAQNGAPMRLVVPWKYGYKGIKSIVSINFRETEPPTSWNDYAANEYGFFSNVNPNVRHPRWSQAREMRLPTPLFAAQERETLMFNGYEEEVASLYAGMDLRKFH